MLYCSASGFVCDKCTGNVVHAEILPAFMEGRGIARKPDTKTGKRETEKTIEK